MMDELDSYRYKNAPCVLLCGSVADEDSEHWATRQIQIGATALFQDQGFTSLTFDQARSVAQDGLTFADLSSGSVDQLMGYASDYFQERWTQFELDHLRVPPQ
jgi:hypothetical protein